MQLKRDTQYIEVMKNIVKGALVIAVGGAITFSVYTINIVSTSESKIKCLEGKKVQQDTWEASGVVPFVLGCETYEPVSVSELPQEIRSEVASRYVAYAVSKVYRDHENSYKIVLRNKNSKMIAFYNADGEYLKQEIVKPVQVVALN